MENDFVITWPVHMIVRGDKPPSTSYGPVCVNFGDAEKDLWCIPIFTDKHQIEAWFLENQSLLNQTLQEGQQFRFLWFATAMHLTDALRKMSNLANATHIVFDPRPDFRQGYVALINDIIRDWSAGQQ